eukprot:scaffold346_cov347-Pavlova_lutheri.AAC.3
MERQDYVSRLHMAMSSTCVRGEALLISDPPNKTSKPVYLGKILVKDNGDWKCLLIKRRFNSEYPRDILPCRIANWIEGADKTTKTRASESDIPARAMDDHGSLVVLACRACFEGLSARLPPSGDRRRGIHLT